MAEILVLYFSRGGSVARLARHVARGIGEVDGMSARIRSVPPVATVTRTASPPVPDDGAPYVEPRDVAECTGYAIGTPTRFGNMAAPVKHWFDGLDDGTDKPKAKVWDFAAVTKIKDTGSTGIAMRLDLEPIAY